jgi:DNA-binding transcriptional ArsR family regulator
MTAIADADVASVAALVGDRARCAMLHALIDGSERPAGELAKSAGVSAATASGHLQRLVAGGLVSVRSSGRHRYYGLSGPLVASALEALSLISPPVQARSLRQSVAAAAMAEARSCYDHLAGRAGTALRDTLLTSRILTPDGDRDFRLTDRGLRFLGEFGVDPDPILRSRRMLARDCLDWTERKPHLAGALPAALLTRFLEVGWLDRRRNDRGLTVTDLGRSHLPTLALLAGCQSPLIEFMPQSQCRLPPQGISHN